MEKERRELLQIFLENTNTWLHFAEAKNAALIVFNIALLTALINSKLSDFCVMLFTGIIIGLLISTMLSLYSFKPINKSLKKTDAMEIDENLLHYAYIASMDRNEYIIKLYDCYWNEKSKDIALIPQIEKDYSEEIVQNSKITMKKQSYFKKAFYIDIIMIFAVVLLAICA